MILLTFCFYLTLQLNHISGQLNEHTNVQQNQTISHIVLDANETNPIADNNQSEMDVTNLMENQLDSSDIDIERKRRSQQTQLIIDFSGIKEKRIALQRQISEGDDRISSIVQNQEQRAISKTQRNISEFQVEQ
ncbi:unnamed protein product [Schistosoma margrebowiei]|nr:unnamed protein product [Schistosoma margrebowiei]